MTYRNSTIVLAYVLLAHLALGCGASGDSSLQASSRNDSPSPDGTGGANPGAGGAGGASGMGEEKPMESAYEAPVATGRFLWIPNPLSGRVALVNAATLEVFTAEAGNGPKPIAAIPSDTVDGAIVINEQSNDATILRVDTANTFSTVTVAVADMNNRLTVSKSGAWAVAWSDARKYPEASASQGFQDVTIVRLTASREASFRFSVGYRPAAVVFTHDESRAFAATEDGLSVIELGSESEPRLGGTIAVDDDPFAELDPTRMVFTPDGTLCLTFQSNGRGVTAIDTQTERRVAIDLGASVSDLDIASDGKFALAVMREVNTVAVLPIPGILSSPTTYQSIPGNDMVWGSSVLAADAPVGLLFSNASDQQKIASIVLRDDGATVTNRKVRAPMLAAFLTTQGDNALLVHAPAAKGGTSILTHAFGVIGLTPELPAKIVEARAPITSVSMQPSGQHGVVIERDDLSRVYGAYLVGMGTQRVDRVELASPPMAAGIMEQAERAYIAQEHTEGRITFVDLATGQTRTLTGFELGARVIDE